MDSLSIDISALFGWLTGPAGAVILSVVILWWIAKGTTALVKWTGEKVELWINRHFDQIDELVKESHADRELYQRSIVEILKQFESVDKKLTQILDKVE
jgi:hypothetical protein